MITDLTNDIYKYGYWSKFYYRAADDILFDKSKTKHIDNDDCFIPGGAILYPEINIYFTTAERVKEYTAGLAAGFVQSFYLGGLIEEGDIITYYPHIYYVEQHHPNQYNGSYLEKWLDQEVIPHMISIFESEPNFTKVWEKLPIWLKKPSKGSIPAGQNQSEFVAVLDKNGNRLTFGQKDKFFGNEPGLKYENVFFTRDQIIAGEHDLEDETLLISFGWVPTGGAVMWTELTENDNNSCDFTMTKSQVQAVYNMWKQTGNVNLLAASLYDVQMKPSDELIEALLDETMTEPLTQEEKEAGKPGQYVIVPVVEKSGQPEEQTINVTSNGATREQTIMVQKTKMKNVMTYKDAVKPHDSGYIVKEFNLDEELTPAEPFHEG